MKKIVRLTESDLTRLVKKVIKEDEESVMNYVEILDEIESDFGIIEQKLYALEEHIMDDGDLDENEKEELQYLIGDLVKRCRKPKKKGFGNF